MELASCHSSVAYDCEVAPRVLENVCNLINIMYWKNMCDFFLGGGYMEQIPLVMSLSVRSLKVELSLIS